MLSNRLLRLGIPGWAIAVCVLLAARASFLGNAITLPEAIAWLVVATVPPVVLMLVNRSAPQTVAQVLYDAERTGDAPRR